MNINHISINNILGIEELEFDGAKFVEIRGHNGSGKTSAIHALQAALKGGHDATLLRNGAEQGQVVLVLDDGQTITKSVTAAASKLVVTDDEGKRASRPTDVLRKLTDALSVNPIDFLRSSPKERVNVLLESIPLELDLQRIGVDPDEPGAINLDQHALVIMEMVRKGIYDDRTGLNRAYKEKSATVSQLRETLPGEAGGGDQQDATGILDQLAEFDTKKDAELDRVANKLASIQAEADKRRDEIRAETEQARLAYEKVVATNQARLDEETAKLNDWTTKAAKQRELTISKHTESTAALRAKQAEIEAIQKQAAKHEQTRETIATLAAEAEELKAEADHRTQALSDLEAYKSELLATLPIDGLTVEDGKIFRDGVPFERLNTAQQVQIAVEIAKLRAGDLAVVCVDNLELMDAETYAEFAAQSASSGMQMFVTRVSDEALTVSGM